MSAVVSRAAAGFLVGLRSPAVGLQLILQKPRIRHAAVIPFVIVMFVLLAGVFVGLPYLFHLVPSLVDQVVLAFFASLAQGVQTTIYWVMLVLSFPVALFGLLFALFLFSQLLASPFYAILAERTLMETGLKKDEPFQLAKWIRTSLHLLVVSLLKVLVLGSLGLVLFIFSLIPGFGVFAAIGLLLITAFDIADVSFEELQMGLRERLGFFRDQFAAFAGLAVALGLIFLLPGLNFFLFPAAIVGVSEIILHARKR